MLEDSFPLAREEIEALQVPGLVGEELRQGSLHPFQVRGKRAQGRLPRRVTEAGWGHALLTPTGKAPLLSAASPVGAPML